jgi:steroid 5-alpha reductase family enzyme
LAHRSGLAHRLMRPQILLPILLVAFVAVWLTAFPLWYSRTPTDQAGAFSGWAWLGIDVVLVGLFGATLALAAVQWRRGHHKDYPKTKAEVIREIQADREARRPRL